MPHTKETRRANSYYFEQQNPGSKRYIVTCALCEHQGFSPKILEKRFASTPEKKAIAAALKATFKPLHLDRLGRCNLCATDAKA